MRSAGFEPAIPSLGSSYLNQAGLTSLAFTDGEFGIIRLLFTRTDQIGIVQGGKPYVGTFPSFSLACLEVFDLNSVIS
jgi:hypothetical protein